MGKTSEETTDDGSVPTSAEIEAVKGRQMTDSADENKQGGKCVRSKGDGKDEKNGKSGKQPSLRAMIKRPEEAILRRGQMNRLLEARTVRTGFIL